jgi:endoglucanase
MTKSMSKRKKIGMTVTIVVLCIVFIAGGTAIWRFGLFFPGRVKNPKIPDTEGFRTVKNMNLGWNLGNALDAHHYGTENEPDYAGGYNGGSKLDYEISWHNPYTTQEIINAVKDAGFTTLRVPVTWGPHTGDAPDYKIDEEWLDRVQDVVDYGYNIGMYVILDIHHDDHYWFIPNTKNESEVTAQLKALWAQISERFKEYGERLLFDAFNEPRVIGSLLEWGGGTISQRSVLNGLHKAFVETVRASGGNNVERWLLISTYGASYEPVPMQALKLPDDKRLIVSVHCYYPRDFVFENNRDAKRFTDKGKKSVDKMMGQIYRVFIAKGIPVYIGEFGACEKGNELERAKFAKYYLTEAARYGIGCAWWDDGYFPEYIDDTPPDASVNWALLDRRTLEWRFPALTDALREGSRALKG